MPIPKPKHLESEKNFIGRCISDLSHKDKSRPPKQIQAMCYEAWRNKNKKK